MYPRVLFESRNMEWRTPPELFKSLDKEFNFTLDPASTFENALCKKFFTIEDDGLSKSWKGERVYLNPPYGRKISKWIIKALEEIENGCELVVMLIPCKPDVRYFHDYILNKASEIRFVRGRVKFFTEKNEPYDAPFPSMIVVFKRNYEGTKFSSFSVKNNK